MYFHILLYIIILNILFEKVNSFCSFYSFYTPKHTIYKFRHPIFFEKYISCRRRCIRKNGKYNNFKGKFWFTFILFLQKIEGRN